MPPAWWEEVMGFELVATFEKPGFRGWNMLHPSGLIVSVPAQSGGPLPRGHIRAIVMALNP
jgi:hypothetical protein